MPRRRDIGWDHGEMVGGQRHHVQCNYCHRVVIGGITRFKKHLASNRGEVKGCEAAPKEVKEMVNKQLSALLAKRKVEKKKGRVPMRAVLVPYTANQDTESDASDSDQSNTRHESLTFHEVEAHTPISSDHQHIDLTAKISDTFSSASDKEGSAPPRATDIGWAHGSMVDGDRQKIKCRYCRKIILGGGISRLKQHLAGERGNIAPCENVPDDVKSEMKQHRGFKVLEKLYRRKELEPVIVPLQHSTEKRHKGDFLVATSTQGTHAKRMGKEVDEGSSTKRKRHLSYSSQESIEQADIAVARFMYHAGVPFNAANSIYFQQMADAIAAVGPGYKMPSYHSLRGSLLGKCTLEVDESCKEFRKSWGATGCSVMVDRWIDRAGRAIIDVSVYCLKGTMFLKSVDASGIDNNLEGLLRLYDTIAQDVGPRNIVNFLIDATPCYIAAARVLTKKYKTFFWSTCANHCIELMLRGLAEFEEVKCVLKKAKKMCQFIYNNEGVLQLMRKETEGRNIFQPARTEFLTQFLTLQNIVSLKDSLNQMVTSTIWEESAFSGQGLGVEVKETVFDPLFWLTSTKVTRVSNVLTTVLHVADSKERPSIGYWYDAMNKARKAIVSAFEGDDSGCSQYLKIIDQARNEFHSPLHAAAYYLNPSVYYNPSFSITGEVQKGLLDCIETLEPDITAQDNITRDKAFYEDAVGDFSRPVALRGRESLVPATWWSQYASDYPDLQRFAVRILSQTCSITTYQRDWSFSNFTHLIKNRLEHQKLNELNFVQYNLGLQQNRQPLASGTTTLPRSEYDPISLEGKNIHIGDWIQDPGVIEGGNVSEPLARKDY